MVKDVPVLACDGAAMFYPSPTRPHIELATGYDNGKSIFFALCHDFMHYRQYKSGVPDALKNLKSYSLNRVLMCEYEAEKMTAWFILDEYGLAGFNIEKYTISANRYMQYIKWEYGHRHARQIEWMSLVKSVRVPATWWTDMELIEPLSERDKAAFDKYWKRYSKGK